MPFLAFLSQFSIFSDRLDHNLYNWHCKWWWPAIFGPCGALAPPPQYFSS